MRPYKSRILIVGLFLVAMFTAIFFQMNTMMIRNTEAYAERVANNSTKTLTMTGMRGAIYDVNMTPLAYDRRSYNITFYRDPSKSSDPYRLNYTQSILKAIRLIESNGKSTITEFWLKKGEDGAWVFNTGSDSEAVEATRKNQWKQNFYMTKTADDRLMDELLSKYFVLDVLREEMEGTYGEDAVAKMRDDEVLAQNEDTIIKILAVWQASRMNAFNSRPVAIAYDVGFETVSEIEGRAIDLDGISAEESSQRVYPLKNIACHAVGYVGKITTEEQLANYRAKGYPNDALVGVSGIESSLEDQLSPYIAYRQGERVVEIDTRGKIVRDISHTAPVDGNSIVLTIDHNLQAVMRVALQNTINQINRDQRRDMESGTWQRRNATELARYEDMGHEVQLAETGAIVAMDPNSGRVLGYVSLPDYDLSMFEGTIDPGAWSQIISDDNNPLFDRAVSAKDAPGSTFKMCTALAGLASGKLTLDRRISDEGAFYDTDISNPARCWISNSNRWKHQNQTVVEGLSNSCNFFFYRVGFETGVKTITEYAAALGLTSRTNIELPNEATSFVGNQAMLYDPDIPIERQQTYKPLIAANTLRSLIRRIGEERNIEYDDERVDEVVKKLMDVAVSYDSKNSWAKAIHEILIYDLNLPTQYISSNYLGNTISSYIQDLFWTGNETIMLSIGQSITQITPIAAARYVSAIANGGTVYDAQIVDKIIAPDGTVVLDKAPVVANRIDTDPAYFDAIRRGMENVTSAENEGTAGEAFKTFKYKVAAKTGTSQRTKIDIENNSWLVCFAPADDPKIAVVVYIQNGYAGLRSANAAKATIQYYLDNYGGYEDTGMAAEYMISD